MAEEELIRGLPVWTRLHWNARTKGLSDRGRKKGGGREGGKEREREVRSGVHLLSTDLRLMKNEASPLSLAGACSSIFFWWATRVLSGLSPRISFSSQTRGTESLALPPLSKAGFSMPSTWAFSSLPDENNYLHERVKKKKWICLMSAISLSQKAAAAWMTLKQI